MPIRTPRGRGAAYRAIWGWPLHSPARLAGCLAVLLALAIAADSALGLLHRSPAGIMGSGSSSASAAPSPQAPPADQAPARATALPPVPELTPTTLPPTDAPRAALTVATRWTEAWARHPAGTSTQSWVSGLRPYTTDEYLGVLESVDPANVPATRVTGPARAVLVSPRSVRVEVPTDAVTLVVLVVTTTEDQWKVAGYDRASDDQDPAEGQPQGAAEGR